MKHYRFIFIVLTAICMVGTSCKKDSSSNMKTISLTYANAGTTVTAVKGQTVTLTLSNPGDGGYQFNDAQFDAGVLKLNSHTHTNPNTNAVGYFGQDTWTFTAFGGGISSIVITASRVNDEVTIFSGKVSVE